jgi:ABC-type lipoprotein export system ATPase subunit
MSTLPALPMRLEGVSKVFVTDEVETHALSEVSLEVARGEYVSVAGSSGCGKSTLLSILGLLDSPSLGTYWLNGQPAALLADEPTGNLDSKNGEAVMELLRELHRTGATIVMVTYDPYFASYAARSVHLFDGRLVGQ